MVWGISGICKAKVIKASCKSLYLFGRYFIEKDNRRYEFFEFSRTGCDARSPETPL